MSALLAKVFSIAGLLPDKPNDRSLHSRPIPRSGGIGIMAGIFLGSVMAAGVPLMLWLAIALALASVIDDRWHLPAWLRLLAHFGAATALVLLSGPWSGNWWLPLLVIGVVWMTNLYNFMDGADGLAAGMAVLGFGAYAVAAGMQGHSMILSLSLCIAAAAGGFLLLNFPPARIFMGDAGSVPLGFLAGAIGLLGWRDGIWPLIFPLVVFGPFVVDATVTLLRRLLRREKVWQAHRQHYYQRLVLSGWSHGRLAIGEYTLMCLCAAAALLLLQLSAVSMSCVVLATGAVLLGVMIAVDRHCGRRAEIGHG